MAEKSPGRLTFDLWVVGDASGLSSHPFQPSNDLKNGETTKNARPKWLGEWVSTWLSNASTSQRKKCCSWTFWHDTTSHRVKEILNHLPLIKPSFQKKIKSTDNALMIAFYSCASKAWTHVYYYLRVWLEKQGQGVWPSLALDQTSWTTAHGCQQKVATLN